MLDPSQRRLFTFANLLPRALAARLHKWVGEGRYASLFDNIEDTLMVERFQVFDLEAMRAYPVLLEPLLFYVLHRVIARIQDPGEAAAFKLCVLDEAWRFIQHPTLRAYVQEGLKTWRKHNVAAGLEEPPSPFVMAFCDGGYTTNLPVEDLLDGKALVAWEFDGEPLAAEHGGPARLLVPHL